MKISRAAVVVAILLAACSPSKSDSSDTSAAESVVQSPPEGAPPTSVKSGLASATDCPHDGRWALCSIERRLRQSGFVVKRVDADTTRRAGFSVKPAVYTLGRSTVAIFIYRDSADASRDLAKLDTLTVGPVGKPSQWGEIPPMLIRSANMAAVILSQSARQTERAILALTAGPPQPGSPR